MCHTPHNADASVTDAPLWNHEVTTAIYTVYSSPTMDVPVGQPGGISKLCLSCHDGTVAVDNFGGTTDGAVTIGSYATPPSYNPALTTDLSDDHPIGMEWDHQTLGHKEAVQDAMDSLTADQVVFHRQHFRSSTTRLNVPHAMMFTTRMKSIACCESPIMVLIYALNVTQTNN